jgi:mono/diheme cytochrome c family protein
VPPDALVQVPTQPAPAQPAPAPAQPAAAQPAAPVDHGQELAESLGCVACHSPPDGPALSGNRAGDWLAPNITSDPVSGIGAWSRAEVVRFLRVGDVPGRGQAAGPMAQAVESLKDTPDSGLEAVADWLSRQPPHRDSADQLASTVYGAPMTEEPTLRGTAPVTLTPERSGANLFIGNCASCHGRDGAGSRDDYYPSLFHNSATGHRDPVNLIGVLLNGVQREAGVKSAFMPGFGSQSGTAMTLSDEEIATIANYVLVHFGNPAAATVTAAGVAVARGN